MRASHDAPRVKASPATSAWPLTELGNGTSGSPSTEIPAVLRGYRRHQDNNPFHIYNSSGAYLGQQ